MTFLYTESARSVGVFIYSYLQLYSSAEFWSYLQIGHAHFKSLSLGTLNFRLKLLMGTFSIICIYQLLLLKHGNTIGFCIYNWPYYRNFFTSAN